MENFILECRPKIFFGKNSISGLKKEVESYNNILVVYGMGSVHKNGSLKMVLDNLEHKNVKEFPGIVPNPKLSKIQEAIEVCKNNNIDLIIGLGGGSVMDSVKAIAIGAKSKYNIWDIMTKNLPIDDAIHIATIPTMIATGSETNDIFVVLNDKINLKRSLKNKYAYPKFSIMDPTYTLTINKRHTTAGIVDTLSHLLEQYINDKDNQIINDLIITYFKRMLQVGEHLVKDPNNYDLRAEHMYIAMAGYNGDYKTQIGGDFACHGLDYGLASEFNNIHGEGLSIITPNWLLYVLENKQKDSNIKIVEKFLKEVFLEDNPKDGVEKFRQYLLKINAPLNLNDIGIEVDDNQLNKMVKKAQFINPLGVTINLEEEDIKQIYLMCTK